MPKQQTPAATPYMSPCMPSCTAAPPSPRRPILAWLTACVLGSLSWLAPSLAPTAAVAATDHRFLRDVPSPVEAANAILYRACAYEARLHAVPVHPYPPESRHVAIIEDGTMLWRRTEILETDVSDMSVENGCRATRLQQLRQDVLQPGQAAPCIPQRDAALQSHYLLLSQCALQNMPRQAPRRKTMARYPRT